MPRLCRLGVCLLAMILMLGLPGCGGASDPADGTGRNAEAAGPSAGAADTASAEPDPINDRLAQAERDHADALDAARSDVLFVIDEVYNDAADAGDLDRVQELLQLREVFEADGALPRGDVFDLEYEAYREAAKRAGDQLEAAYQQAMGDYTRARRFGLARWVQIRQGLARSGYEMTEFEGRYYVAIRHRFSWHEAKAHCEEIDGELACIGSAQEHQFLRSMVSDENRFWLGATDESGEGDWVWLDGSEYPVQDWDPGQPDNHLGNEHYLCFQINGKLNDLDAGSEYITGFICEWAGPKPDSSIDP